jgi:hypothetical protein
MQHRAWFSVDLCLGGSPDAIHWKKTSNQFVFGGPDEQRMKSLDVAVRRAKLP